MYTYKTKGTCSSQITFDIAKDGTVTDVNFVGGCNGNLQAVSRLVEGKTPEEVVFLLKGITCGFKKTSCGDQLATALEPFIKE